MATRRNLLPLVALVVLVPSALLHASGFEYEAPPTLPYYLDRLPAKPLGQILAERAAPVVLPPTVKVDYAARLLALADAPPERVLPVVDELLAQARREPADAALLANLLGDLRDVFTAVPPADAKARGDYVRWRVGHAEWFGLARFAKRPGGEPTFQDTTARQLAVNELERRARAAGKDPLAANWLYDAGALLFKVGDDKGSQSWFERVVAEHSDHPRAEAARYMVARCELSRSRSAGYDNEPKPDAEARRAASRAGFEDYLKRYPDGRFAVDARGWLGATRFDAGDYLGALGDYVKQAEAAGQGHPEGLKSAAFMAERCLSHLASTGDDAGLRAVAAQPPLALGLVYLVLNSPEADNYDGKFEAPAAVAKWRRALLPRLARAIAARPELYRGADWQGGYLAALAQAASGAGDQARALELVGMATPELLAHSDDLAFARAVVLGRSGKLTDAVAAYREFGKRFPRSPLAPGARLRLALALQDDQQAGAAAVELMGLREAIRAVAKQNPDNADGEPGGGYLADGQPSHYPFTDAGLAATNSVILPNPTGAEPEAVRQLLDTLLNFAPRPELAAGWTNLPDGPDRVLLAGTLAQRALAEDEDFAEARRYLTPAEWQAIAPVAAVAALPPSPENLSRLGDAWAAARGKVVFQPLETVSWRKVTFTDGGEGDADRKRRENARALGVPEERVNAALEGRDELRHARRHWLKAADAAPAGSPVRATALWRALAAVPKVALVSPYTLARADETDLAGESRKLYDRLRRECPDSREAREFAVFYNFPKALGAPPHTRWEVPAEGDAVGKEDDTGAALPDLTPIQDKEFPADALEEEGDTGGGEPKEPTVSALLPRVISLEGRTGDPARLAAEVTALRREARTRLQDRSDAVLLNCLDDLADFTQEPAVSAAAARRYVGLRLEVLSTAVSGGAFSGDGLPPVPGEDKIKARVGGKVFFNGAKEDGEQIRSLDDFVLSHIRAAYKEPALVPFKDYLDALAIAVIANHYVEVPVPGVEKDGSPFHYTSRDYPKVIRLCEGFLKDYPKSRRREAVSLLRARALYFAGRPTLYRRFAGWPESGHFDGGWVVAEHRQAAVDPRTLGAALNEHEREFPQGRYGTEIRHLRASLAWRTQQWDVALRLTLAELNDKHAPDLQTDAASRLASIFTTLATDATERARLLAAIRAQPGAPERLRAHLEKVGAPLALVKTWALGELR